MAMRKRQLWFLIPLVLFLIIIALFYTRLGKDTTVVTNTSLNRALPSFSLPSLGNPSQMITQAQLPKQPFLLNVWASWCVTCKVEHPFLLQMSKAGVPIVGVNPQYRKLAPFDCLWLESFGGQRSGLAPLSYPVSVFCRRWQIILSVVPTLGGFVFGCTF